MACPEYGGKGSYCNIGFLGFWNDCKRQAIAGIEMAMQAYPDYPLVVTGHSLGAAAAVYAAVELRQAGKNLTLVSYLRSVFSIATFLIRDISTRMASLVRVTTSSPNTHPTVEPTTASRIHPMLCLNYLQKVVQRR
jgi:thioesterase domain-containing protein